MKYKSSTLHTNIGHLTEKFSDILGSRIYKNKNVENINQVTTASPVFQLNITDPKELSHKATTIDHYPGTNKDQRRDETDQKGSSILMTENNNIEEFVDVKIHSILKGADIDNHVHKQNKSEENKNENDNKEDVAATFQQLLAHNTKLVDILKATLALQADLLRRVVRFLFN